MPDLLAEVIGQAKAALLPHALQAATTPMHSVLGQEEDEQGSKEDENDHHKPDQILIHKCPHTLKFKSPHFLRNQQQLK